MTGDCARSACSATRPTSRVGVLPHLLLPCIHPLAPWVVLVPEGWWPHLDGRFGGSGERGAEFAFGQGFEGAEAVLELTRGQSLLPIQAAQEILRRLLALAAVALHAAGNQISIRIHHHLRPRQHVIQALHAARDPP